MLQEQFDIGLIAQTSHWLNMRCDDSDWTWKCVPLQIHPKCAKCYEVNGESLEEFLRRTEVVRRRRMYVNKIVRKSRKPYCELKKYKISI
jgi:hypothetical protein